MLGRKGTGSWLLAIAAAVLLSGCARQTGETERGRLNPTPSTAPSATRTETVETVTYTSTDGRPPLEETLKELYTEADRRYQMMVYLIVDTTDETIETNFGSYHRVSDDRFASLEELRAYLSGCFTDRIVNTLLPADSAVWIEHDGKLFVLDSGKGVNPLYAGHVFRLISRDDSHIRLSCARYFAKEMADVPDRPFYEAPADSEAFQTDTVNFEMVRTGDGWRFDVFSLLY